MAHDPVVADTVRERDSLEPHFVLADQDRRAAEALAGYRGDAGRRPNVLLDPLRRRRLGRLRLLRRRRRGGGADAEHRPAGPPGHAAHLVLLRAVVHAVAGLDHDRAGCPCATACSGRRCTASPAGCDGEVTLAQLLSAAGLRDPGGRQVAHGRERGVPAAERRLRRLLRLPLGVGHVHRVARPVLLPRDRLQRGAHRVGREPPVQQVLRARRRGAARPRTSRRSRSRCSRCSTTSGPTTRSSSSAGWASRRRRAQPWFLYHCTRGAHFDNYPHERFLGSSPAKHPYKDTIVELDDIVGRLVRRARGHRPARGHAGLHLLGQRPRDGDLARRRLLAVPQRQGLDLGGRPAGAGHRRLAGHDRRRPGHRRPVLPDGPVHHRAHAGRRRRPPSPSDRYIDGVDQTSFLLDADGQSNRKYLYYWLDQRLLGPAGRRVEVHGRLHLRRRPRRAQPGRLHRGHPEVLATAGCTTSTSTRRRAAAT